MAEDRKMPEVGNEVVCFDEEGEEYLVTIDEVGDYNAESDTWEVSAGGDEYSIYMDGDNWTAAD